MIHSSYSLKGLPAEHKCPECALAYNVKATEFRTSSIAWLAIGICNVFATVIFGTLWFLRGSPNHLAWIIPIFGAMALSAFWRHVRSYKNAMIVSSRWIQILKKDVVTEYLLREPVTVQWSMLSGKVFVHEVDGNILVTLGTGSVFRAYAITKAIRKLAK